MNIFEFDSRHNLAYPSTRGDLTSSQLWSMPLQHSSGFDLDNVARAVNAELKAQTEESFVQTTKRAAQTVLEVKLEVVKHIIAVKLEEAANALTAAQRAAERDKLVGVLAAKQEDALKNLSPEELQARIAELS